MYFFFIFSVFSIGEAVLTCTIHILSKIRKITKNNLLEIFNFYNLNNLCIFHGRVFVMLIHEMTMGTAESYSGRILFSKGQAI